METVLTKPRSDAWDAPLDEAQRWRAYAQFRRSPWFKVSTWIADEFKLPPPSRTSLYRWAARMRALESAHRIEQAVTARDEVDALAASAGQTDARLIDAYKTMAAEIAMRTGDAATASTYTRMALDLAAAQAKRADLDLKARAQETKDAALRLAREKFTAAEARLAAARKTLETLNQSGGLTPEARAQIEKAMGML
jgi:uncharacterized protein YhaN